LVSSEFADKKKIRKQKMPNHTETFFNAYLLRAVQEIQSKWALKGYDIKAAYTHDLRLGEILFKATNPPLTMCVAAQMEIMVTALKIYADETGDKSCQTFLPSSQWTSLQAGTFKDLVWVNSGSKGTADALEKFGMGKIVPFTELKPGAFINLNRKSGTGHAVLFLSYLDGKGESVETYSSKVAGFKYYSSQGKGTGSGFDYRYAFFEGNCPVLEPTKRRDCHVIRSENQKFLNTGMMFTPTNWRTELRDTHFEQVFPLEEHDVNPAYREQITTDDVN
jgi:hypothetical protein